MSPESVSVNEDFQFDVGLAMDRGDLFDRKLARQHARDAASAFEPAGAESRVKKARRAAFASAAGHRYANRRSVQPFHLFCHIMTQKAQDQPAPFAFLPSEII